MVEAEGVLYSVSAEREVIGMVKKGVRQQEGGRCAKNKKQNSACSLSTEEKERRIMSKITEPWVQAAHAVTY